MSDSKQTSTAARLASYVVVFVALGWWWTMVGAMCMLFAGASTRNTMEKAKKQEGGANAS